MAQKRGRRRRPLGPLIMTAVFSVLLTLYLTTGLLLFGTRSVMMQFVDKTPTAMGPSRKDHNGIRTGVLSQKKSSYFQAIQQSIDGEDPAVRCARYRSQVRNNTDQRSPPRYFFGSLVAEEPWELLEIVAAESYGIYHAIVLVEANRTQNFTPRPFKRLHETKRIQQLFGVQKVQVRPYVNEIPNQNGIWREQDQRAQILKGWKDLGMQPHDIGLLGDLDETFTRDFLRAAQTCQFPILDYQQHYCEHSQVKVIGQARVFEASPECIQDKPRRWLYPGMIVGQCLEEISDPTILNHPKAPRKATDSFHRERGWGVKGCNDWGEERKIKDNRYPLFSAADFRKVCAGGAYPLKAEHFDLYTSFHFHNFFASLNDTRHKHSTYGHPNHRAINSSWTELGNDQLLMYNCIQNRPDRSDQKWKRVVGGLQNTSQWWPIYFQDTEYRRRRHSYVQKMMQEDEERRQAKH